MAHDNEEQEIGTSTEEEALAAFQLHEELDERRDRNKGKPESEFNFNLYETRSLTLRS